MNIFFFYYTEVFHYCTDMYNTLEQHFVSLWMKTLFFAYPFIVIVKNMPNYLVLYIFASNARNISHQLTDKSSCVIDMFALVSFNTMTTSGHTHASIKEEPWECVQCIYSFLSLYDITVLRHQFALLDIHEYQHKHFFFFSCKDEQTEKYLD